MPRVGIVKERFKIAVELLRARGVDNLLGRAWDYVAEILAGPPVAYYELGAGKVGNALASGDALGRSVPRNPAGNKNMVSEEGQNAVDKIARSGRFAGLPCGAVQVFDFVAFGLGLERFEGELDYFSRI